ncbi:MAG: alpha/beta hydrolase, partial [Deltaproteobacteria bacterium]|nr:alpha/beta hydrolase [Deltaproteobacteria bacterium]
PHVSYDENLYDRQLLELLSALSVDSPVDLVGLSMGGAIATIFAVRHPELVKKLVLVDPAGYPVHIPLLGRIVRTPIIGDYLMQVLGNRVMMKEARDNFYDDDNFDQFIQGFKAQMIYRGYKRAILSTLRNFNLSDQRQSYETVGRQGRPVLLFWGREDRIIPFENSDMIQNAISGTVFHAIDNCGHIANFEKPEIVNPILVDFLMGRQS